MSSALTKTHPQLILACYGMNDGILLPLDPGRQKAYQDGMIRFKKDAENAGARIVFITAPLFAADHPESDTNHYDDVLQAQADWLLEKRKKDHWEVIDIRPDLKNAVAEAKKRNPAFVYAADGVHPGDEGHSFIARSVADHLWPLLKLPGTPDLDASAHFEKLRERAELLKIAWLTKTGYQHPDVKSGPLPEEVQARAATLLQESRTYETPEFTKSQWANHEQLEFTFRGRAARLVLPKTPATGNPWIWRTEFFGHEPQADIALLEKGFHVAYLDLQNLYGAPVSIEAMKHFHGFLTGHFQFNPKAVMEGFSRGGLFALNFAVTHPSKVSALYLDAPVCDFKSWPAGKGKSEGSPGDWQNLIKVYQFSGEEEALAYKHNPLDQLKPIAEAGIPILAVVGQADKTVPVDENIDILEKRFKAFGGKIRVIRKPGCDHHPHSLPDPKPIVDFVTRVARL